MSAGTVLITGAGGNLGRLVVQHAHRSFDVIAVDRRPLTGLPKDVEAHDVDVRWRPFEDVFRTRRVDCVVHMGLRHNPRSQIDRYRSNVVGTQRLLELAARYDVKRFVMLSSANIYGPDPDNSHFLTEDSPLLGAEHHADIRDLVAVDATVQGFFYRQPEVATVLLRPVHIVGPRVRNAPSNYLRLPRPWTILGFDPMVQLIHEADVVRAILLALRSDRSGVFNVVGPGEAPLSRILRVLGRRPRPIPMPLVLGLVSGAWRAGLSSFPPPELRHVQFNCVVDGTAAKEKLGFEPQRDLIETIRSVDGPPD